ncbi:hypothetical protein PSHT_11656 [Puccinia striiformis]|uniref:Uncharacterized protein n=1 Tax=Puccinia striiformis TaxID=27350 RepID=A0A2S4V213_9BASI|nr:hypothetical protein PSHT_11656 [Puccinia striiformis]
MGDSLSRPDRGPLLISTTEPYRLSVDAYADEFATQWDHYQSLQLVISLSLSVAGGCDLIGAGSTSGCKWVGFGSENLAQTRPKVHAGLGWVRGCPNPTQNPTGLGSTQPIDILRSTTQTGASGNNKARREIEDKFKEVAGFLAQTAPCFAPKSKPIIEKHSQAFDSRDTIDYIQIPGKLW